MVKRHDPFAGWLTRVEAKALKDGLDGLEDREFDLMLHRWQVEQIAALFIGNGKNGSGSKKAKVIKWGVPSGVAGAIIGLFEMLRALV